MEGGGFKTGRPHSDPDPFIFSIPKLVSFKKLNGMGQSGLARMRKFLNLSRLHFICVFIFYICFFLILLY